MKEIEEELNRYYAENLSHFGAGAKGVGWKNDEAQKKRFIQLSKAIEEFSNFSINDLGCGVGDFYDFLLYNKYQNFYYNGFDVLERMVSLATERHQANEFVQFFKVEGAKGLIPADYTVASGIFNLKYHLYEHQWVSYILETLYYMNSNSIKGFAFNMLTKYSDKEYMQDHLYYADPLFFFDYCKKNYSRNVALLHDYNEYDFTLIVRK